MLLEATRDEIQTVIEDHGGARILVLAEGRPVADLKTLVNSLIAEAWSHHATVIAFPVSRLRPDFFQIRTGIADGVIQKLENYRLTVAFIGDIPDPYMGSMALRDFIRACNRGSSTWFVDTTEDLIRRLSGRLY